MKRQPDLRKLARRQRWIIWLFLGVFVLQCVPPFLIFQGGNIPGYFLLIGLLHVGLWIALLAGAVLLLTAQGSHPVIVVLVGLLMILPPLNFLILLLVNQSVTRTFGRAGVRVGLMGVNAEDLERALNPWSCKGCGYDLTGNISGVCPECGRPSPRRQCEHCNEIVEASPGMECPRCLRMMA